MLDEDAVAFKKTVFVWEAHLLKRPMLDKREVGFEKRCSTGRPICSRRRCWTRRWWISRRWC